MKNDSIKFYTAALQLQSAANDLLVASAINAGDQSYTIRHLKYAVATLGYRFVPIKDEPLMPARSVKIRGKT